MNVGLIACLQGAYFFIIEMVVGYDDADPSASESRYEAWLQYLRRAAPMWQVQSVLDPWLATKCFFSAQSNST